MEGPGPALTLTLTLTLAWRAQGQVRQDSPGMEGTGSALTLTLTLTLTWRGGHRARLDRAALGWRGQVRLENRKLRHRGRETVSMRTPGRLPSSRSLPYPLGEPWVSGGSSRHSAARGSGNPHSCLLVPRMGLGGHGSARGRLCGQRLGPGPLEPCCWAPEAFGGREAPVPLPQSQRGVRSTVTLGFPRPPPQGWSSATGWSS